MIGAGPIGTAFAAALGDAGAEIWIAETDPARRDALPGALARAYAVMVAAGLARAAAPAAPRLATAAEAAADADLVLECGPERREAKRALMAELLAAAPAATPVATASSAFTVSTLVDDPELRARALVAHPLNPPSLLRVVELVPAPESGRAVERAAALLARLGFEPVVLGREIPGFVANRLQGAMLREAYRLVAEGVVDLGGLDRIVRDGLGPRWALSGPFETAELNTGGIAVHAARMGPAYRAMGEARGERDAAWPPALVAEVERQRRALLPAADIPARTAWRETALARLLAARKPILDNG